MTDFARPSAPALPLHVNACALGKHREASATSNLSIGVPSAVTWVANLIAYNPVTLPWDFPVNRVWWFNGTTVTSTNVQFGIYTADGRLIYATPSTVQAGAAAIQYVTPSPTFMLPAGNYYFAWTCNNTTGRGTGGSGTAIAGAIWGLLEETPGVFGLPATMTPVRWARAWGYTGCGLTRTTTGF